MLGYAVLFQQALGGNIGRMRFSILEQAMPGLPNDGDHSLLSGL